MCYFEVGCFPWVWLELFIMIVCFVGWHEFALPVALQVVIVIRRWFYRGV